MEAVLDDFEDETQGRVLVADDGLCAPLRHLLEGKEERAPLRPRSPPLIGATGRRADGCVDLALARTLALNCWLPSII